MKLNEGPISQEDLMLRLANAKKVMNRVDGGEYSRGNIKESDITETDESEEYQIAEKLLGNKETIPLKDVGTVTLSHLDEDKINRSKLPEAIKRKMLESPTQISLNDSLNMDFIAKTKKIMEQEGVPTKKTTKQTPSNINNTELINTLTPIIENIIRKVLDEKLNQILTAQQTATINENLVLKVGDSIFKGKITGVSKAK